MRQERFQPRSLRRGLRTGPLRGGVIRLGLGLGLVLGLLVLIGPIAPSAAASTMDGLVVRSVRASDSKILAQGGQTTVTVTIGGLSAGETEVTLIATFGSFGSASGPARIVLTLQAIARGDATASAELFGDGRSGTSVVTARIGESTRSTAVLMAGAADSIEFEAPQPNAVHDAALLVPITLQLRDADGITVPDTRVELSTDDGLVSSASETPAQAIEVVTDRNGRASASLRADPGLVLLRASAGHATARLQLMLHGPPVSLDLIAIRDILNPGIAPPGTLVAILLDDGGRPVPDFSVDFATDREDASVSHNGEGESGRTDDSGRATGHLVSDAAVEPGEIVISVSTGTLSDSATLVLVGPPSQLVLTVATRDVGSYVLRAEVLGLHGVRIPEGFDVHWSATGLASDLASVLFDPIASAVADGLAATVVHIDQPTAETVQVIARVVPQGVLGEELATALVNAPVSTLPLPEAPSLSAGLNAVRWVGPRSTISSAVAPIMPLVLAAWYFDVDQGWRGYFPAIGPGGDFQLAPGSLFSIYLSQPIPLPGVELLTP